MVGQRGARDRFVAEAARLFAARGYAATSVADIQIACGLTPGSGALYKHFATKRDLLEAVIATHVTTMQKASASFAQQLPDDLVEALHTTVRAVWDAMRRDSQVLRVTFRDLDAFPDLLDVVWHEVRVNVYDEFACWLHRLNDEGVIRVEDPAATAAVLLSSLTYHPILFSLIGHHPGDVDAKRFEQAWVRLAAAALSVQQGD